jgi:hypothetical protein
MKIAIIAPPWVPVPPSAYGGTEAVLDTLARGLQDAGHEILLYSTGDSTCEVLGAFTFEHALGTVSTGSASELCHVADLPLAGTRVTIEVDRDAVAVRGVPPGLALIRRAP